MTEENKNQNLPQGQELQTDNKAPVEPKKNMTQAKKEPGFFVKLFSKKDKQPQKKQENSNLEVQNIAPTQNRDSSGKVGMTKVEDKPEKKGNIFTKLFNKKEKKEKSNESIIENIVAQTDKAKEIKKEKKEIKEKVINIGESLLKLSNLLLKLAIIFIMISAGFFYAFNIDEQNRTLGLFDKENHAVQLTKANKKLEEKREEEKNLNKEITKYKKGYINEYESVITKIIDNRMNWSNLMSKINSVTEFVYPTNALSKYVQYSNYSYDVKNGKLTISGILTDSVGQNLTKLAELEESFMYYPKNKNDPEDKRKPYFYNMQDFKTYTKTLDKKTNRYKSNFAISLYYTKDSSKK